ncbi:L-seryl-tRNA(Sec) selenium transferase [Sutcliffiella deserti]|uniref:L-seryl-tRNA(Sec) selenium transferase n=1 Tax=Sutcliffiella deserti TaxID=2875501 RepID=UPI001CBF8517|nr:L-seryl-tRNA(Sec) selenium transferase [Sutcliffiella deserti]
MNEKLLREIPPVHELKRDHHFHLIRKQYDIKEDILTHALRETLDELRTSIRNGEWSGTALTPYIWETLSKRVHKNSQYSLKKVINATGTILHTNLGRASLSREAINRVVEVAGGYSNLEYNIDKGSRGSRYDIVESIIKDVTGAEAAIVVNNNAAAVFLVLKALAKEKEVIVSRGQLVEIGGSFRISSIMEESGAKLVEVGTTNKTHRKDYEEAITEQTSILLKVHTSNFKTIGFTQSVPTTDLVSISENYENLIVYEDLGSGVFYDFTQHGIGDEPVVQKVIESGVDLVSFSGDKLLGGPQAGIIAGKKKFIDKLKKDQLARVLRVDKMSYAALEATLQAYQNGKALSIPTVRDILQTEEEINQKAMHVYTEISKIEEIEVSVDKDYSMIGGGTMPDVLLSTYVIKIKHSLLSPNELAEKLRKGTSSIIVRIHENAILLDFRTITQEEIPPLLDALKLVTYHD